MIPFKILCFLFKKADCGARTAAAGPEIHNLQSRDGVPILFLS